MSDPYSRTAASWLGRGFGRAVLMFVLVATLFALPISSAKAANGGTLTLDTTTVELGDPVVIEYSTPTPMELNWIGIYEKSQSPGNGASQHWLYAPEAAGTVTWTAEAIDGWDIQGDVTAGEYVVYFLADDGYELLADPVNLTVTVDGKLPATPEHQSAPIDTSATDGVIFRESFDVESDRNDWEVTSDPSLAASGDSAWRGWTFTTREHWTQDIDQMRYRFARSHETLAVVDPAQFGVEDETHTFATTLTSVPVPVTGQRAIELSFDSHYRGAADQRATVTVTFDDLAEEEVVRFDSTSVTDQYDASKMNSAENHVIDVPAGAQNATFRWHFEAADSTGYWAIDSVTVRSALPEASGPATSAWVVSDIQGHPTDLSHGLMDLHTLRPNAAGLLVVGDIVDTGAEREWNEIYRVLDERADICLASSPRLWGTMNAAQVRVGMFSATVSSSSPSATRCGVSTSSKARGWMCQCW